GETTNCGASGAALRERVALELETVLATLFNCTLYGPTLLAWALVTNNVLKRAPGISTPLKYHRYFGRGNPRATSLNETVSPGFTDTLVGCCVMTRGTGSVVVPGEPISLAISALKAPPTPLVLNVLNRPVMGS